MRGRIHLCGRISLALALAGLVGAVPVGAQTEAGSPEAQPAANTAEQPQLVRVQHVVPPRRRTVVRHFTPWSRPGPAAVRRIIRAEARRWKVDGSRLARRVGCESTFRWWAGNGPYRGLLQFHASTFYRGWSGVRDRRVRLVSERSRIVRGKRILHYSDGHTLTRRGKRVRQRVVTIRRGTLPKRPELTHGWAQLRIGAQAIRGISRVSSAEWSCPA